jgi:uncharacterized protein YyaL (SSP411 family)
MNRLSRERSPYLLQHAANPVDWYPWGDEAFSKARAEDKPIFLSIGYSTCHWCHVMEHESFERAEVAAVLNAHFVPVKVDREERPDVDRVYMTFVQATTGSGGWPMSVWLTPELKPFYGGTYFPPASRWGRPGFVDILEQIARVWRAEREKVAESADAVTRQLAAGEHSAAGSAVPGAAALARTVEQFRQAFDPRHGGFGDAPKFPRPSELLFLLREHARAAAARSGRGGEGPEPDAGAPLAMALRSLRAMALGGMRDHVGGGFHRYSVDAAWRVPHFEKMLYDQAQLVLACVEGAQASGDRFYLDVAEDTLRYVMREMTDAGGGFFSAEDADSIPPEAAGEPNPHKAEGAFYLWRAEEIDALLGADAPVVKARFGIEPAGNAPIDPQQEFAGKNLLYVARTIEELAADTGHQPDGIAETLNRARFALFRARLERPRPHLDDKVLTAWNGLMIAGFARTARVVGGLDPGGAAAPAYLDAARKAAEFIRTRMWNAGAGTLLRRYRDGHAGIEAYAEDFACLIFGLLELFQADPDPRWLEWARTLQRRQDDLFWDDGGGGWFSTTGRDPSVLLRMKEDYDGAEPAVSSVSVLNLLTLAHLGDHPGAPERIEKTLRLFGPRLEQAGRGVPMMAAALSTFVAGVQQIVIAGDDPAPMGHAAASQYLPFAVQIVLTPERQQALTGLLPWIASMHAPPGSAAAYVCRDFACRQPVTRPEELEGALA